MSDTHKNRPLLFACNPPNWAEIKNIHFLLCFALLCFCSKKRKSLTKENRYHETIVESNKIRWLQPGGSMLVHNSIYSLNTYSILEKLKETNKSKTQIHFS